MFIKIIRSDTKQFNIGGSYADTADWGITEITGIGEMEFDISTEKNAVGDGETVTSNSIPLREIEIEAVIKNRSRNAVSRKEALKFFNPKYDFKIYVSNYETEKWIDAKLNAFKCPQKNISENLELSVMFICPDPFWNSIDNFGKNLAAITGNFGFPWMCEVEKTIPVGIFNFAQQVLIDNTGDIETYCTVEITANDAVTNPKILVGSAYVRLIDNLVTGDVINIDLVNCYVTKNGANCMAKIDRTSSFADMGLEVGDNAVSFTADNGDTNMAVVLYYNLKYLGV